MTNSDRFQEIRARVEAATKGPWSTFEIEVADEKPSLGIKSPRVPEGRKERLARWGQPLAGDEISHCGSGNCGPILEDADAEFIAASREDIPWLLQLVTKQENEIAWLRTWIFRLDSNFESAAKKIMVSNTEEPMTIEQVKEFLGIDPGSAFGTPGTAD